MKRQIFILTLGIFLINLISASPGFYQNGQDINLLQTCANCSYINITSINSPNGTILIENVVMTKEGSVFNYTLDGFLTQEFGEYKVNGIGDSDGIDEIWIYSFEVTPSGFSFTNALSLPVFLPMILIGIVSIFFFFMVGFTQKKEYKFTYLIFSGIFLIFSIAYGIIASRDILYGFPLLYNFINSFYRIFIIALQVGGILIPIIVAFFVIKKVFNAKGYNIK